MFPTNRLPRWRRTLEVAALAALATVGCTSAAWAGGLVLADEYVTIEVPLTLEAPTQNTNRFDVQGALNTLVPGRAPETATGVVEMEGEVTAKLYFDPFAASEHMSLLGLEIMSSDLRQAPTTISFGNLPVAVNFATGELGTQLVRGGNGGMVGVGLEGDEYRFAPDAFHLMHTSGDAAVSVAQRRDEQQLLEDFQVEGQFRGVGAFDDMASISLNPVTTNEGTTYNVSLQLPMLKQFLEFRDTGLPVELEYISGALVAGGSFSVPIPEPSSLVTAGLLVSLAGWRLRARRPIVS